MTREDRKNSARLAIEILRAGGQTYEEIGNILGISRQRVYTIHTWERITRKIALKAQKKYVRKHVLIINGKFHKVNKRPRTNDTCELCGREKLNRLHYHHWNDEKPEHGIWVCSPCHRGCEFTEKELYGKYLRLKLEVESGIDKIPPDTI